MTEMAYPRLLYGLLNNSALVPGLSAPASLPFVLTGTAAGTSGQKAYKALKRFISSADGVPSVLNIDDYLIPTAGDNPWNASLNRASTPNSMFTVGSYQSTMVQANSCLGSERNIATTEMAVPAGVLSFSAQNLGAVSASSDLFTSLMVKFD